MAEQREDPRRVRGPPVVLVAVQDDRGVARDALGAQELGEALAVEVVAQVGVVEVGVPVDLDRARDVPGLVEQHVLVGLDDDHVLVVQVLGEPVRGDEAVGVGVGGDLLGRVEGSGHGVLLRAHGLAEAGGGDARRTAQAGSSGACRRGGYRSGTFVTLGTLSTDRKARRTC
ncbi:hypothetical protein D3C74_351230 [compost metagenome]